MQVGSVELYFPPRLLNTAGSGFSTWGSLPGVLLALSLDIQILTLCWKIFRVIVLIINNDSGLYCTVTAVYSGIMFFGCSHFCFFVGLWEQRAREQILGKGQLLLPSPLFTL